MGAVKINPLRNEKVYIRFVPHEDGYVGSNKSHVLYGGLADGATVSLCVPLLRSTGTYKNVLTNDEKEWIEEALGLDRGALSVYRKEDNYWDSVVVRLNKEGVHLDLSNPEDYIKYAVLRANSDIVAPSVTERVEKPKATYMFEIVRENEEVDLETMKMDTTMECYDKFNAISNDYDTVRVLISLIDGRPYSIREKMAFFKSRANILIQKDAKVFLDYITDPLLASKVIIQRGMELGKITCRGNYYYLADGSQMCEAGENPTLTAAARFINSPAHQDIKYILESEIDKNKVK